jgi:hypothetical protein
VHLVFEEGKTPSYWRSTINPLVAIHVQETLRSSPGFMATTTTICPFFSTGITGELSEVTTPPIAVMMPQRNNTQRKTGVK